MLVYRIEEEGTHLGPFAVGNYDRPYTYSKERRDIVNMGFLWPEWEVEGIPMESQLVSVFTNKKALDEVFPADLLEKLTNQYSFVVREIDVPDNEVYVGHSQQQGAIEERYILDEGQVAMWHQPRPRVERVIQEHNRIYKAASMKQIFGGSIEEWYQAQIEHIQDSQTA